MKYAFLLLLLLIGLAVAAILVISPPADPVRFLSGRLGSASVSGRDIGILAGTTLLLAAAYWLLARRFPSRKNRLWIPCAWAWKLVFLLVWYAGTPKLADQLITHLGFSIVTGIGLWMILAGRKAGKP